MPQDTLRLVLRYGINAIDTSPYYTTSEAVMGKAFAAVADEFPRSSYQLITKAGRYGRTRAEGFDYAPSRVRSSVARSLELLGTTYLDGIYMHDVEFVSESLGGSSEGGMKVGEDGEIREEDMVRWGLAKGEEGKILGPGDQKVLDAMAVLFELKKEGLVRAVGFTGETHPPSLHNLAHPRLDPGFPLPTLLRLARLVAFHLQPLDIMLSYCHHTIQNTTLSTFLPLFKAAGVKQVLTASPLSMGLLRGAGGQPWHPGTQASKDARAKAVTAVEALGTTLERVALGYGFTSAAIKEGSGDDTPTVVGLSTPEEVHQTMEIYRSLYHEKESRKGRIAGTGLSPASAQTMLAEKTVMDLFKANGSYNETWMQGLE